MTTLLWSALFAGSAGLLVWSWVLYPVILWAAVGLSRRVHSGSAPTTEAFPVVSIIIAAHNEQAVIAERIENCLAVDYPADQLDVIVVSDNSTDGTEHIVERYGDRGVRLIRARARGKSMAQNDAVEVARGEILLFSDADTLFDRSIVRKIVLPFADPRVGCATGRIQWRSQRNNGIISGGGMYWRFERFLWRLETALGILAWGSGACLALRHELFRPMEGRFGDDCVLPLDAVAQARRVVYVEGAVVDETAIETTAAEFRARVRMTLRSFSGTLNRRHAFSFVKRPGVALAVLSHKLLRWFTPYLAIGVIVASLALHDRMLCRLVLVGVLAIVTVALLGWLGERAGRRIPIAAEIFAFLLVNSAWGFGVAKALFGHSMVAYRSEN